ncbi:putative GPI ethanolamine phosphate transferase [Rosellinia necatrix]|uniref:GPI ethanolamine phosphate transferase 2 n=1 Tax=Rosellinia necatrix TaxID=77044 RepID=A0A1W2TQB0_ROSNE|nr:putative GPI ethanolamine phosphate transferase [Rosellinia necatrix]
MIFKGWTASRPLLLLVNPLILLGTLIFMSGLFRSRPLLEVTDLPSSSPGTRAHSAPFDKVIFMVIDALRTDFVFAKDGAFPFTQGLIRSGAAVPVTALSAMPTLTLSRIKALTQGSSQSFLDAWLNVVNWPEDSRLDGGDTWLARLKASRADQEEEGKEEKQLVFHGIEEWVDLYPDVFDRKEVFSSFHLPGLVDVDRNITGSLAGELARDDWAALVLHYLGLDCIAHVGGPRSAHMRPKQLEMDAVVRDIYAALARAPHMRDALLVLLGDHGMTAHGNHGGRLPEELAAATVFISPKLAAAAAAAQRPRRSSPLDPAPDYRYYSAVNQIDVVPTLAGLMGFPIPSTNAGVFIPDMLPAFGDDMRAVEFLLENAKQIHRTLKASMKSANKAVVVDDDDDDDDKYSAGRHDDLGRADDLWGAVLSAEKAWVDSPTDKAREHLKVSIYEASRFVTVAQSILLVSADNISIGRLYVGVGCLVAVAMLAYASLPSLSLGSCSLFVATAAHAATMFIPGLVEEEHHFWYWGSLLWLIFLSVLRTRRSGVGLAYLGLVALHFMGQCINTRGTRYSMAERIDDLIFAHPIFLWIPALLSHISASVLIARNLRTALGRSVAVAVSFGLCAVAFGFKLALTYSHNPESLNFASEHVRELVAAVPHDRILQAFWTGLLACSLLFIWQRRGPYGPTSGSVAVTRIVELLNLYLRLQSRPRNLSFFLIFEYQIAVLLKMGLSPAETATTVVLLGQSAFYSMGRDNTIASLDLLNGFNGLSGSSIIRVIVQSFLSNWIGPVWWSLAGLRLLASWREGQHSAAITTLQNGDGNSGYKTGYQNGSGGPRINHAKIAEPAPERATKPQAIDAMVGANNTHYVEYLTMQTLFSALSSLALDLACMYIWGHEDLWDIYGPKFINAFLWVFFHQLMVNGTGCSIIWFLVGN